MERKKGLWMLIAAMLIFGTIGIFRKYIPLGSGTVACCRAVIGTLFLLTMMVIMGKRPDQTAIRKNLPLLCISGAAIGFNWILLFEAYRYTSVAVATLCYYMAPVFVVIASPFLLKERLSVKKMLCVLVALIGIIPVSGVMGGKETVGIKGILFGLSAAVLYAGVILLNKRLREVGALDRTVIQLGSAAVVLLPYVWFAEGIHPADYTFPIILLLLVVGIIHTGLAYLLYFGSLEQLKAQTAALYSYIDPIAAIVLSAVILGELPGIMTVIGAVLILGAAVVSDLTD